MPTGVALHDPRAQLLAAGQRVLLREGPGGLTSRSVTEEAEVSKGVLHRHFDTFDDFLVELVRERRAAVDALMDALQDRSGAGTVVGNLVGTVTELFGPLGLAVVRLLLTRDGLSARLRGQAHGVPVLVEAVAGIRAYLVSEQAVGRIVPDASADALAHALVGTCHLLFAGELGGLPDESAVRECVESIVVGAERGPTEAARSV